MQRMLVILIKDIPNLALYWISNLNLCVIMEFGDFNSVTSRLLVFRRVLDQVKIGSSQNVTTFIQL